MKYTKEVLAGAIAGNQSMAGVMRSLGAKQSGGLHHHLMMRAREWGIDMSHFTGSAHLRGKTHGWSKKHPLGDFLIRGARCHRGHLKERLVREGLLKSECGECGQGPEWKGKPLVMVLDHINGVNDDNRLENLRLLCPNCNSQTGTFCSRNRQKHDDQHVLDVVSAKGVRDGARDLGMKEHSVRERLRLMRGRAGTGKRA